MGGLARISKRRKKNRGWVLAGASSRGREHSDLGLALAAKPASLKVCGEIR